MQQEPLTWLLLHECILYISAQRHIEVHLKALKIVFVFFHPVNKKCRRVVDSEGKTISLIR
jgi:hypothetical protein